MNLEEQFPIGTWVNVNDPEVSPWTFLARVNDYRNGNLVVEDLDSDLWEVSPDKCTLET